MTTVISSLLDLTESMIDDLRTEAGSAGDLRLWAVCEKASRLLERDRVSNRDFSLRALARGRDALATVSRAILDAQAQIDTDDDTRIESHIEEV